MDDFYILFCKNSMEIESLYYYNKTRTCLKKAFCKMCVTICGRFRSDEGAVAGYGNRIRVKSPAKWGVQIAGMIFQTRSSAGHLENIARNVYRERVTVVTSEQYRERIIYEGT